MKKFKSKFFCVATEGATTDGRVISVDWIKQMADTFNPKTYGARVWLEHMRGLMPDGPFKAYGDVLSLSAREKEDGKLGLFAEIAPTDDLVAMNKSRQKIYTSIEVNPDFAGTGKAYLMGLAITDTPASLGTEMLEFTQKNPAGSPLTGRKLEKDNLFTAAVEAEIELVEIEDKPNFSDRIKSLLQPFRAQADKAEADLDQVLAAVEEVAQHSLSVDLKTTELEEAIAKSAGLQKSLEDLQRDFTAFKSDVEKADVGSVTRPPATGGTGAVQTDC